MGRGRRATNGRLHGILIVDKPAGWTSHDVVGRIRRLTRERRVGHAGTLDPAATGVLPVLVGDGTRVVEFLAAAAKGYRAEITLGVETDSHDIDGVVTATFDGALPDQSRIERALDAFRGPILQLPPMHSAIQIAGQRLYEAARRGEVVEREQRPVTIYRLDLIAWRAPVLTVEIACSKGTYIRTIAHDLGVALGTGAYLSDLVRTWTGPFSIDEAWTIGDLEQALGEDPDREWPFVAIHPDIIIQHWPAVIIGRTGREAWFQGRPVPGPAMSNEPGVRAYDDDGTWLGIGHGSETGTKPWKVVGNDLV
jgi:tRNA pseudouridine55 synthase